MVNLLKNINNDFLIKYYDYFEENNIFNVLMEYGGEINLKQFIKNYKNKHQLIEENIIKDIVLQLYMGLKEIHKNKIIHRNLTPDNIFINKNNKIKIGVFSISEIITKNNKYANTIIGKHLYFAPELYKQEKYDEIICDNKIDIYSLGCIIYELFTLNEYFIDTKIENKSGVIDIKIYNRKWQELLDLLLQNDYHKRPNIDTIYKYIQDEINNNYIIAEIYIDDNNLNKDLDIINSYEEFSRIQFERIDNKYCNEKEIKKCEIKINNKLIPFNYCHKFNSKGKNIIKYSFKQNITNTKYMFAFCHYLANIDLSHFNSNNITNISYMFYKCSFLKNINLSNFKTKNVTNMEKMFSGCRFLTNIDLYNFNTNNVRDMSSMFYECSSLTNINLASFDTNNVTDMSYMFCKCSSLTNINLSNFNTHNVTNMEYMFDGCSSLSNINLSNFNTNNVNSMDSMFRECSSLTNINLSNFNTNNVTNMSFMFCKCSSLTNINLSNFNTNNVTNMEGMFDGCSSLSNINLSNFNTNNVTNISYMFDKCSSLTNINLSNFNTNNVTSMGYMFEGCSSLTNINLSNFNTNNVNFISGMFDYCSSLKKENIVTNDNRILNEYLNCKGNCIII